MGTIFEIYQRNFSIKEIPIIFKDREKGSSKIPKMEILRTLKNLLILFLRKFFKWCPHQESNLKFILTMDTLYHLTIGAF